MWICAFSFFHAVSSNFFSMFLVGGGAEWTPFIGTSFAVGILNNGADVSGIDGMVSTLLIFGVDGHCVALPDGITEDIN